MPHEMPLIATIVAGLVLAFTFGGLANRFRIPPLVGYLVEAAKAANPSINIIARGIVDKVRASNAPPEGVVPPVT